MHCILVQFTFPISFDPQSFYFIMSFKHIIYLFLSVYSTSAFMLSPKMIPFVTYSTVSVPSSLSATDIPHPPISLKDPLYYKNNEPQDYVPTNTINVRKPPSPDIYLPRHSAKAQEARIAMHNAELILGRLAMIAAIVLFGVELLTGTSLPDQLSHMIG